MSGRGLRARRGRLSASVLVALALLGCRDEGPVTAPDAGAVTDADAGEADVSTVRACDPPPYRDVGTLSRKTPKGDDVDVYFPAAQSGPGAPLPIALFLQGANVPRGQYASFAREIAGFGFVVVVPDHRREVFNTPGFYPEQDQIHDAIDLAKEEHAAASSPLSGRCDPSRVAVLGHSFGGATTINAAASMCAFPFCNGTEWRRPAEMTAAVVFGANLKSPFGDPIPAIANAGLPVLLIQGTLDGRATLPDGKETFTQLRDPPKAFVELAGVNHYGICEVDNPPGANADPNAPAASQEQSRAAAARWAAAFLRAYVLKDAEASARFRTGTVGCGTSATLSFVP